MLAIDKLDLMVELNATGERIKVARNLHRQRLSIRRKDGKVAGYAQSLKLADVQFHVSEAGRQRCIREGKKNVHAFASGRLSVGPQPANRADIVIDVSYNPYRMGSFYDKATGEPVEGAEALLIWATGEMMALNPTYGEEE